MYQVGKFDFIKKIVRQKLKLLAIVQQNKYICETSIISNQKKDNTIN